MITVVHWYLFGALGAVAFVFLAVWLFTRRAKTGRPALRRALNSAILTAVVVAIGLPIVRYRDQQQQETAAAEAALLSWSSAGPSSWYTQELDSVRFNINGKPASADFVERLTAQVPALAVGTKNIAGVATTTAIQKNAKYSGNVARWSFFNNHVEVGVGAVLGPRDGMGQVLVLKRTSSGWRVIGSTKRWIA